MNKVAVSLVIDFMSLEKAEICSSVNASLPIEKFGIFLLQKDILILEHRLVVLHEQGLD